MRWFGVFGLPLGFYSMSMGETSRADPALSLLAGLGTPTDTPGGKGEKKGFRCFTAFPFYTLYKQWTSNVRDK